MQFFQEEPLGFDIEDTTKRNTNYRQVVYTGKFQLTLMSILPGEDIGMEVHSHLDQFIRVESGTGQAIIETYYKTDEFFTVELKDGMAVIIPAGHNHNILNNGNVPLKLYSIYSSPEHAWNKIEQNKV